MPLKPHPTDPDKMVYVSRYYDIPQLQGVTVTEEPLHPVHIGVDVTKEGTAVTAFYRKPDAVMEMFYSQFHPMPQRTWVGLTDKELEEFSGADLGTYDLCLEVEAKLRSKNI